jgi:hypothetical protein
MSSVLCIFLTKLKQCDNSKIIKCEKIQSLVFFVEKSSFTGIVRKSFIGNPFLKSQQG